MLTARDELKHLADTLTEEEAERALEAIHRRYPSLLDDEEECYLTRAGDREDARRVCFDCGQAHDGPCGTGEPSDDGSDVPAVVTDAF